MQPSSSVENRPPSPHEAADLILRKVVLLHQVGGVTLVPPPRFAREQVSIGTRTDLEQPDGTTRPIRLPDGPFSLQPFLAQHVPSLLSPDVSLMVWAHGPSPQPRSIQDFPGKKVLLVGDTHYHTLLREALCYAAQEPFDAVFVVNRYHAHWFREAQRAPVHWLPGIATDPQWQPIDPHKTHPLVLIGHQNKTHHRRRILCSELTAKGYPLKFGICKPEDLSRIYQRALISLNISLNGDANFRYFEVPPAGGFFLTDRVSELAGVESFFDEGEHYAAYSGLDELCGKLDTFLFNPAETLAFARRGQSRFNELLRRDAILSRFWSAVDTQEPDDRFNFSGEPRHRRAVFRSSADLLADLTVYLELQELQRRQENADVLLLPGISSRLAVDCADLHRLTFWIMEGDEESAREHRALMCRSPLRGVVPEVARRRNWDAVVGPAAHALAFEATTSILVGANKDAPVRLPEKRVADDLGYGVIRVSAPGEPQ